MSSLAITARPRTWDEIVGQPRAIGTLKDILRKGKFSPRGVILEGPSGVGKTTTARILARALMCTGGDPLGCGGCPSCLSFGYQDGHPDFREVDGASYSGVAQARQIVDEAIELPGIARTRVLLLDEAHRLSREAWDVYLKPLEEPRAPYAFIFSTTDARKIPGTILSRCCTIRFSRVATDVLEGFLAALAARNSIDTERDGLRAIARAAKGHVRDALGLLDKVASLGKVTRELVGTVVDTSYTDMATDVLAHLAADHVPQALTILDDMARSQPVSRVIEEIFAAYGRAVFGDADASEEDRSRMRGVKDLFPNPARMTEVLIKWTSSDRIPVDALPLFAHEIHSLRSQDDGAQARRSNAVQPSPSRPAAPPAVARPVSGNSALAILGAVEIDG